MHDEAVNDPFIDDLFQADLSRQRDMTVKEQRRQSQLLLAVRNILNTEDGKRFLYWTINETGVFAPCFTGNSQTFFLEGKRSVGLAVYRLLMTADPNALQEIINFQRSEESHGEQ